MSLSHDSIIRWHPFENSIRKKEKQEMKGVLLGAVLFLLAIGASGQGTAKGTVVDNRTGEALPYVYVKVLDKSGTLTGGAVTDERGKFVVAGIKPGNYEAQFSMVGYTTHSKNFSITAKNPNAHLGRVVMREDVKQLKEVTVTGQKSAMKLEVDRKTFDVSQLATTAGTSALESLESIPSVEVDNEDNISLRGNTSVEVWINGKASGLTSDNRADILRQIPTEDIERIEVIDNPSAKYSAEGSVGIINIVLKKDRKPGYYGSLRAGFDTRGGVHSGGSINYNSSLVDFNFNIGYRHREDKGKTESEQEYLQSNQYQWYKSSSRRMGNNLFTRGGLTFHLTKKDDIGITGMLMKGKHKSWSTIPYHSGTIGSDTDTKLQTRYSHSSGPMQMFHGELDYRHNFTDNHFLDINISRGKWKSDDYNHYHDSIYYYDYLTPTEYEYQYRPMYINNRNWEVKVDYENPISEHFKIEAGYQGEFSHENTPQESYVDEENWDGSAAEEDQAYYNRFIYDRDVHALYGTATLKFGKFGVMGGLRGEYWKVHTESYTWSQEHDPSLRDEPFEKDYFELFPSLFLSYQITENDQLQLNYTRRLRRPWGGQLNSFKDTRDATSVSFGNPLLTPEFSNSFSMNYLRTWNDHSLLASLYYRPTSDVMQRISWQNPSDGLLYSTTMNVASSKSSGAELTVKNKLWRILDLTTSLNAYYYKLNGFTYDIDGQTVTGESNSRFSWNARMTASLLLPSDLSVQATGRYHSRSVITQGYRKSGYGLDLGVKKNFLGKRLTLSVSCRDVLNSRRWENYVSTETFTRHQLNKWGSRKIHFTLSWNFGNMNPKRMKQEDNQQDEGGQGSGYGGYEEE